MNIHSEEKSAILIITATETSEFVFRGEPNLYSEYWEIHTERDPSRSYEIVFYYADRLSEKSLEYFPKAEGFTVCAGKWIDDSIFEPDDRKISVAEVESESEAIHLFTTIVEFGCTTGLIGVDYMDTKRIFSKSNSRITIKKIHEPLDNHGATSGKVAYDIMKQVHATIGFLNGFFCIITIPRENGNLNHIGEIQDSVFHSVELSEYSNGKLLIAASAPSESLQNEIEVSLIAVVQEF